MLHPLLLPPLPIIRTQYQLDMHHTRGQSLELDALSEELVQAMNTVLRKSMKSDTLANSWHGRPRLKAMTLAALRACVLTGMCTTSAAANDDTRTAVYFGDGCFCTCAH